MTRHLFLTLALLLSSVCALGQNLLQRHSSESIRCQQWVDSVMLTLSDEQKLGQLLMPLVPTNAKANLSPEVRTTISNYISRYHVGGFLFSKVTLLGQAQIDNEVQRQSVLHRLPPALISIDGEWGPVKRLADGIAYPSATIIGRIQHVAKRDSLCYAYGREMARQLRLMGVHINFAPVLDINSNALNPVIGTRAFGTRADTVIACSLPYARGLEEGGVLSVAKHFPGHGDTDTDSHLTLPRLNHSAELMHSRELLPFQAFIDQGYGGIMVAHLDIPALNGGIQGLPATASKAIVHDLLQGEMHFRGLTFTDGLAMKGVASRPDICVEALLAGCDVLVQPTPFDKQYASLSRALKQGYGSTSAQEFRALVDAKCRKVLQWKYALIIDQYPLEKGAPLVSTLNLADQVNSRYAQQLNVDLRRGWDAPSVESDPTLQTIQASAADPSVPCVSALTTVPRWQVMTQRIDSIARHLVKHGASPGCQILVAHKGQVIYHKAWGWKEPQHREPVTLDTYYDLASLSKVSATLPALMYCFDQYDLKLTDNIQKHLPQFKGSSIGRLTLRQCLLHETGLPSGFPFYKLSQTTAGRWDSLWVSASPAEGFVPLAQGLWVNTQFRDTMRYKVAHLTQRGIGRYRYSDINFMLLRMVIEQVSGMSLDQLLYTRLPQLYGPSGKLLYRPLEQGIDPSQIAPTEQDNLLRHQLLRGYVHDETAAWSGGVEGNAGLFGSAAMLYPLLQTLLDEGWITDPSTHHRQHLFRETTVRTFLSGKSGVSRRGLGFDKPDMRGGKCACSTRWSAQTVGHTGFSGTCFWIDPKEELIYIFMSNRICPSRDNVLLTRNNYRISIQEVISDALKQ